MKTTSAWRQALPLVVGLAVGALGAALFRDSLPGAPGSPEERAKQLEVDLQRAERRIAALEASGGGRKRSGRTVSDAARELAEDFREGRPVTPDDIFRAAQPLLRDLSPILDRMRVRDERRRIDSVCGELARKYDLSEAQQASLQKWFQQKSEAEAKRFSDLVAQDGTRLQDLIAASRDVRPDEGLDQFMGTILGGPKLEEFRSDRMTERAERVQQEADMRVQRLDSVVNLDDAQREQVFGLMARGSRDYDPAMKLEGVGGEIAPTPAGDRQAAMLSVLRPEQRAVWEAERQRRREEAAKDLEAVGMSLPPDWDLLDDMDFR